MLPSSDQSLVVKQMLAVPDLALLQREESEPLAEVMN